MFSFSYALLPTPTYLQPSNKVFNIYVWKDVVDNLNRKEGQKVSAQVAFQFVLKA